MFNSILSPYDFLKERSVLIIDSQRKYCFKLISPNADEEKDNFHSAGKIEMDILFKNIHAIPGEWQCFAIMIHGNGLARDNKIFAMEWLPTTTKGVSHYTWQAREVLSPDEIRSKECLTLVFTASVL